MVKRLLEDKDERRLLFNIFFAFIVKGASLFVSLFSMPLYIKYFNDNAVLGMWFTILSLLSWISICDLGVGNGLRNRLTEALVQKDKILAKKYVVSTYGMMVAIILPVILIGNVFISFVDLNSFLNLSGGIVTNSILHTTVTILLSSVCISFILKNINMVFYAVQKPAINNILSLFASTLPVAYVAIGIGSNSIGLNLIHLSVVYAISINLPLLIATFVVFFYGKRMGFCDHLIKSFDFQTAKKLLTIGMQFFFAQVFFMLFISTNEIYITRIFSPDNVVEYSVYFRLFSFIGSLFMLALTPMWSKVTRDLAEHKYTKIQRTNRVLYAIAGLGIFAEFAIIPFLQLVINIWLKENAITINYATAVVFALFGGLYILNIVLTTVANGMGELRTQIVFFGIGAILKIPACIILKHIFDVWSVVVFFNCVILLLFCVYQLFWIEKRIGELIQKEEGNYV